MSTSITTKRSSPRSKSKARARSQSSTEHPPGTIGFSIGSVVRYIEFVHSLQEVWRPKGTTTSYGESVAIPENMNTIIRNMLPDSEWLWIQSDDHIWRKDSLRRLLDRDVDVVVPFIVRRDPPFVPVINKRRRRDRSYQVYPYSEIPTSGMFEVHTAGTGGMLIRRHVFDAIKEWQGHDRVFEVEKGDKLAEDYVLCSKMRRLGFKIYCDVDVTMGHQSRYAVWPEVDESDHWRLRFDVGRTPDGRVSSFYYGTGQQETRPDDPIDFDAWRASYDQQTFKDQQEFYSQVWDRYPDQQHWTWSAFEQAIKIARPFRAEFAPRIVELGGWDGALARAAFARFELGTWLNLEICREIVERQVCQHEDYRAVVLTSHIWDDPSQVRPAEIAVATHTFEHMKLDDVLAAVRALDTKWLYIESPLEEKPTDWTGYLGSHILEVGWRDLEKHLRTLGYKRSGVWDGNYGKKTCRLYVR